MSNWQRQLLMFAAGLGAFFLDTLSKGWANASLEPGLRHVFVPPLLNLLLVNNTGLAFSMANENGLLAKFLSGSVFVLLLYFYWQRYRTKQACPSYPALEQLGMAIVIGAAAGNLLERFLTGHVTDFLEFAFISFPVFNVADVLIDTGIGLALLSMFCGKNQLPTSPSNMTHS